MIPSDLVARLRLLNEASFFNTDPPVAGLQRAREIQSQLPELVPGQRFFATLQRTLPDGSFRALVAGQQVTLSLNTTAKAGDTLELVVAQTTPKAVFARLANPEGGVPANSSAPSTLSPAGKLISFLLTGQPPPKPAVLANNQPMVNTPPTQGAALVPALRQALAQSGLFYESHQAQWLSGKTTLAALQREPQAQAGAGAGAQTARPALPMTGQSPPAAAPAPASSPTATAPQSASLLANTGAAAGGGAQPAVASAPSATLPAPPAALPGQSAALAAQLAALPGQSGGLGALLAQATGTAGMYTLAAGATAAASSAGTATHAAGAAAAAQYANEAAQIAARPGPATLGGNPASAGNPAATTAAGTPAAATGATNAEPTRAQAPGASAEAAQARPVAVAERALPIVHQQLDALATNQYVWNGMAWPGQKIEWIIEDPRGDDNGEDRSADDWNTTLRLSLPRLGGMEAILHLTPAGVALRLRAEQPATMAALEAGRADLEAALAATEVPLTGMVVELRDGS